MTRSPALAAAVLTLALVGRAAALSTERWTNPEPYGVFFNDYEPNFYTGFAPRVQERERIKLHVARGNQLRARLVLSEKTIENYIPDQVARHDLYRDVIDAGVIQLTTNTAWEAYDERFRKEGLAELAKKRGSVSAAEWRQLNLDTMQKLSEGRLHHIQKDFNRMLDDWAKRLAASNATTLDAKLDLVNDLFPHRIFAHRLSPEQDAALAELVSLARANDPAFRAKGEAFFHSVTDGIYPVRDGKLDYWEFTAIYASGSHDETIGHDGRQIPQISTPGVWPLIPRMHGKGIVGMVDYISSAGYYGLMPMLPYEHGGGIFYNAIHNTGISNWIAGHRLLPLEWRKHTAGSRNGKPFNRVAITSRGPVSHGCTRLNNGHLTELREMLPSTSDGMRGIVQYRNVSHCYDVFDVEGDGVEEVIGVQYYIAYRHTDSRVMEQIWVQNNREDFYRWLYGDDMTFGPIGGVTMKRVCDGRFVERKAREGRWYENLTLYEAPYAPETLQFYRVKGRSSLSPEVMEFNRELRRVGYGYTIDRARLFLR